MSESIADLLAAYRLHAAAHAETNDGSAAWVERVNHAADEMLLIARRVAGAGPDAVARFAGMMHTEDPTLSRWAAHHVLDFMEPALPIREAALGLIERAALDDAGERLWLENYRGELQDE